MRDRTFGVEIECGYDGIAECSCYDEDGCYCDEDDGCRFARYLLHANGFSHWTGHIHSDGSGVEIPSPILKGWEGLRELERVLALLRSNGFTVSDEDGLHVHHGAPEFVNNEALTAHLVEMWEENLHAIDSFVANYRREGTHWACASHKTDRNDYWSPMAEDGVTERWKQFKESKSLGALGGGRFHGLNVRSLRNRGTVEFRLHEGTLDFDEISAWIHFGQAFLEFAKKRKTIRVCSDALELVNTIPVAKKAGEHLLKKAGVELPVAA